MMTTYVKKLRSGHGSRAHGGAYVLCLWGALPVVCNVYDAGKSTPGKHGKLPVLPRVLFLYVLSAGRLKRKPGAEALPLP